MKKRSLALFLAAFVTLGTVLAPADGMVYAATEATEVTETAGATETTEATEETAATETTEATEETEVTETTEVTEETETTEETEATEETETTEETEETESTEEMESTEETESTETSEAAEFPTGGKLPMEFIEVPESEIDASDIYEVTEEMKQSAVYNTDWDKYSNNYFYNQMSTSAKTFWDALDTMCRGYLTTTKSVSYDSTYQAYIMDYVTSSSLTKSEVREVYYIFRYSNPQYYFLNSSCLLGTYGNAYLIAPVMYSKFADGSARATATAAVQSQVNSWQSQINACANDEQKVKLIHDLIIQKVEYNNAIYDDDFDEDTQYSQSVYSVFCTDLTVCAGYSQAFEMMCNGSGIDALAVTSSDHEWNKVRINASWYNVDCTWDDQGNSYPVYYDFFARNDAYYDSASGASSHQEESYWNKYLPLCTLDSTYSGWNTGVFPTITQQTAAPQIVAVTDSEGDCEVTLTSSTPDATIYYTTDGTDPSESATKSLKYSSSFYITDSSVNIRAIAVCNGYFDSAITAGTVVPSKKCTITFKGNGATSGSMSSQTAYTNSTFSLKKNAFKKSGYSFAGWNTKKNGKGTSYTNKQTINNLTGDLTLYAQWKLPSYKITYKLNGGTNNKKNPASYTKANKVTLKNPTKKGYTFKGWYKDRKYKNKITTIKKGSTGKITLYAKWQANTYTIKFNGNGSTSGKMNSLTSRKYGSSYKLSANKFKKKGYVFTGWNTRKNGTGKSYSNKQKVKNLTTKNKGNVTLYAQWKKK